MSNDKAALNMYGILDNELTRMHELMRAFMTLPKDPPHYSSHSSYGGHPYTSDLGEIYKRIITMQDLLMQSLISHDKDLQERIAELALMGSKNEAPTTK